MLSCKVISSSDWELLLRKKWDALFFDSLTATPFQSFEWVSSWWRAFGSRKKLHLFVAYEGEDLIGIMPMYTVLFPYHMLTSLGKGLSDYLGPLVRTGYENQFSNLLNEHLRGFNNIDLIDLQQIRETHSICNLLSDLKTMEQESCFVLDLPDTYDDYVKTLSKSMRYEARRIFKGPYQSQKAILHPITDPSEVPKALKVFYNLHAKRWRKRGLPGSFANKSIRDFHQDYAQKACIKGDLRMSLLEFENQYIGAIYAMKADRTVFFYQSGFDPAYQTLSPGSALVSFTIHSAIQEGMKHFDFMRGAESYKERWNPQHNYKNLRILKSSSTPMGIVGKAMKSTVTTVRNKLVVQKG